MHGFIFSELKKYVSKHFGEDAWDALMRQAGLGIRNYEHFRDYPDDEVTVLVSTASKMTKLPAADILEGFGEFIAADLVAVYRPLIDPSWRTLEFLENVESVIHRVVRGRNQKAKPPAISCSRVDADEVMITYGSKRKLCALARGIVQGTANLFGEAARSRDGETQSDSGGGPMSRLQDVLQRFKQEVPDFISTDIVHLESGLSIGGASAAPQFDAAAAAAAYAEVIKSNARALELLGKPHESMEDILVTTDGFYVLLRTLGKHYYYCLAISREGSLGLPRVLMRRYAPAFLEAIGEKPEAVRQGSI